MALCASSSKAAFGQRRAARPATARVARVVKVQAAAADRPVWLPGTPPPAHLDGTLAGDFGFDPLGLGAEPKTLKWFVQAELVHGRWAMLGAAGILFTGIGAQVGLNFPQWYEAGKVSFENGYPGYPGKFSWGTLFFSHALLIGWAEHKRLYDIYSPGSQGDGSFFGITDDFKAKENGYPGGRFFDFFGLSRGSEELYQKYKWNEIRNGRLAMVANVGFWAQYAATGKGPIQNLADHLADPGHVNAVYNGISVPFYH